MNEQRKCRRCSGCANSEHHWMECCEIIDEGLETGALVFDRVCKHCELLGSACEQCDGYGGHHVAAYVAGEVVGEDFPPCETCHGVGVIPSCLYSEDDE